MSDPEKILIVDDEPNVRLVFRTTLEAAGYDTETDSDGVEALDLLKKPSFDLVLLDLQMPIQGGMSVLQSLRQTGINVPVVIITAYGTVPDAVAAMKLGAIDFLGKPLSPVVLRQVVADVIERQGPAKSGTPGSRVSEHITAASAFAKNLLSAKHALNQRLFDEAEIYLKQALALDGHSAEVHNLLGVPHEVRNEHDASYREYKAALKADRHSEPAKHNMTRYYERFTFGRSEVPVDTGER